MMTYRILERQSEKGWVPFAVAYRRGERFALFAPPWRGHRTLEVASLDELGPAHFPSGGAGYRWAAVQETEAKASHPIELIQEALGASLAAAPVSAPAVVAAADWRRRLDLALRRLRAGTGEVLGTLKPIAESVPMLAVAALEVTLEAATQAGLLHPQPALACLGPEARQQFSYASAEERSRRGIDVKADQSVGFLLSSKIQGAEVVCDYANREVRLEFLTPPPQPPLVILVPADPDQEVLVGEVTRRNRRLRVRFTGLTPGAYLLAAFVNDEPGVQK
jgi:hypothetical protein